MAVYKLTYKFEATPEAMEALDFYLKDSVFPDAEDVKQIDDGWTPYEIYHRVVQGFDADDISERAKDAHEGLILTDEEVNSVMDRMEEVYDANYGMCWETISTCIEDIRR